MTDMNEGFFTEPDNEEKPKNELPDIEIPEDDIPVYAHDSEKQKRSDAGYRVSQRGNVSQHRRRSRFVCFCVPVIISCALLCCILPAGIFGGVAALAAVADSNKVTDRYTESLVIDDGDINLEVTNLVGSTRILGADVDSIQVEIEKSASGLSKSAAQEHLDNVKVDVRREGSRYIIEVTDDSDDGDFNFFGNRHVELRITVPRELNITASNDVGELSIRDVEIINELKLRNDVGGIEFDGTIASPGNYEIINNVGGIEVNLDHDSSVRIDARADVGRIDVTADLQNSTESRETVSHSIEGVYGDSESPEATLTIRNDVGGIHITD